MNERFGWVEWKGGLCPVDGYAKVKYLLRYELDESDGYANSCSPACCLDWDHKGGNYDIVAYKVIMDAAGNIVNEDVEEDPVSLFREIAAKQAVADEFDRITYGILTGSNMGSQLPTIAVDMMAPPLTGEDLESVRKESGPYRYDSHEMLTFHELMPRNNVIKLPVRDSMRNEDTIVRGFGAVDPSIGVAADIALGADDCKGCGDCGCGKTDPKPANLPRFDKGPGDARMWHDQAAWARHSEIQGAGAPAGGIGDINSSEKGSGARFNAGKVPYDLVPLTIMAESYLRSGLEGEAWHAAIALLHLGEYQSDASGVDALLNAMAELGVRGGWEECARVFDYGRAKYKCWNWSKGMAWSVPLACAARHLLAMIHGEILDPESGLPHRGHAFCNLVMLITFAETYEEGDDLPEPGQLAVSLLQGDYLSLEAA